MSENMNRDEMENIKRLGEQIGYGNLICWASALWRDSLRSKGYPVSGAFIGVCECTIKDEQLNSILQQEAVYDSLVRTLKDKSNADQ